MKTKLDEWKTFLNNHTYTNKELFNLYSEEDIIRICGPLSIKLLKDRNFKNLSFKEIGEDIGKSRQQTRKLHNKCITLLTHNLFITKNLK